MRYLLRHERDDQLFWAFDQWIDQIFSEPILYTEDEKKSMTLPKNGVWIVV